MDDAVLSLHTVNCCPGYAKRGRHCSDCIPFMRMKVCNGIGNLVSVALLLFIPSFLGKLDSQHLMISALSFCHKKPVATPSPPHGAGVSRCTRPASMDKWGLFFGCCSCYCSSCVFFLVWKHYAPFSRTTTVIAPPQHINLYINTYRGIYNYVQSWVIISISPSVFEAIFNSPCKILNFTLVILIFTLVIFNFTLW